MIHFRATGRAAYARTDEPLTTGSVGIPVDVSLSSDFDGLQAVMVFRSGDTSADVALLGQDVVVPPQVLTGRVLSMGVYASSTDGTVAIPTVWCDVGLIRGSAATEFDPAEPTPGWSAQIQAWAEDAADSATQAAGVADSIRADMDEFNESSAIVLDEVRAATTAANGAATNANAAASAANASASAADAATADAITATRAANTAASAVSDATALATSAAGVATTAAGNADTATAAARAATADAQTATTNANAATSAASAATTDAQNATAAASQATADATTATAGANTAAAAANMAADGANDAAGAANAATSAANSAANQATAAANNANSKANAANTAANNANAATSAANDATTRANSAIDAMGDISEQAVPVMSADVRGGAKIQPNSGLEIAGTDNLQVRLALESEGDVRGGLAQVTAKGHAEQRTTTGKNLWNPQVELSYGYISSAGEEIYSSGGKYTDEYIKVNGDTQYIWKLETPNSSVLCAVSAYDESKNFLTRIVSGYWDQMPLVFTTPSDCKYLRFNVPPEFNSVQLELGSTATEYEPYTGGAPSPSPDYPQEIQVVRGRNLLDKPFQRTNVAPQSASACIWLTAGYYTFSFGGFAEASVTSWRFGFRMYDKNGNAITDSAHNVSQSYSYNSNHHCYLLGADGTSKVEPINVVEDCYLLPVFGVGNTTDTSTPINPQLELGSTPQPYVPYGHVGLEVQGRNLFDKNASGILNGYYLNENTGVAAQSSSGLYSVSDYTRVFPGTTYKVNNTTSSAWEYCFYDENETFVSGGKMWSSTSIVCPADAKYLRFDYLKSLVDSIQLELGSTATDYQPYYHTTTPIPLPQRGWVAGLPDGTADVLTLDGAGRCKWTLPLIMRDTFTFGNISLQQDGTVSFPLSNISAKYGTSALCNVAIKDGPDNSKFVVIGTTIYMRFAQSVVGSTWTDISDWLNTHCKLLHELATPVTEDCGYCEDWPTDIPDSATVSIPELDAMGVKYFIDSAVTELARQWHERIAYERTVTTQEVLASVAPIEHSPAESNHSVGELITYEGALYRVTAAIARGESIIIGTNVTATTVAEQLAALQ